MSGQESGAVPKAASHYNRLMPYCVVEHAAQFIDFLKELFQAEEVMRVPDPNDPERGIMHAEVRLGDSILMLAGATADYPVMPAGMFIHVSNTDDTYQQALALGAQSIMEPRDESYGRSAGVRDSFGNTWWLVMPLSG